ncbi:MAG: hypothetical protein P4L22_07210 [Candidatus Babeliales bacterium]|nr:hypothetical protein [Candidatus Babeliales bacterium]
MKKAWLIILSIFINYNLAAVSAVESFTRIRIEFFHFADLETFIDESINLPGDVWYNSSELLPFHPNILPYIIFRFEEPISKAYIERVIHEFIHVDIKKLVF